MVVINSLAVELVEPGGRLNVSAPVFVPSDVELGLFVDAQHFGGHEGADVQADAVIKVGLPADGLLGQRLPAHEDVVGGFAFQNGLQAGFKILRCGQAQRGAVSAAGHTRLLRANPVAQVSMDKALQVFGIELVGVDQRTKAIFLTVPYVPDKRAVLKAFGVLLKKAVAQPHRQPLARVVGLGQHFVEHAGGPTAGSCRFPCVN